MGRPLRGLRNRSLLLSRMFFQHGLSVSLARLNNETHQRSPGLKAREHLSLRLKDGIIRPLGPITKMRTHKVLHARGLALFSSAVCPKKVPVPLKVHTPAPPKGSGTFSQEAAKKSQTPSHEKEPEPLPHNLQKPATNQPQEKPNQPHKQRPAQELQQKDFQNSPIKETSPRMPARHRQYADATVAFLFCGAIVDTCNGNHVKARWNECDRPVPSIRAPSVSERVRCGRCLLLLAATSIIGNSGPCASFT